MIITQTPLRISFAGGGTDLPGYSSLEGGAVLGTTINKYVYVLVMARFEDNIRVSYSQTEIVEDVNAVKHELVREALKKVSVKTGVEVITVADIPAEGTGLGSSSATTVGLLNGLYQYTGDLKDRWCLAENASEIEIDVLGKPIGKQDQFLSALGGLRKLEFATDGSVTTEPIPISRQNLRSISENLMLFYTGISRKADPLLARQDSNTSKNLEVLRSMKSLVFELEDELHKGNIDALGEILHRGWCKKVALAEGISTSVIDEAYKAARRAGALGGKVTGAGGGGFLLFYVPPGYREGVRLALKGMRELPFELDQTGSRTLIETRGLW